MVNQTEAKTIVITLLDALPPRNYLTLSHPTLDFNPGADPQAVAAAAQTPFNPSWPVPA